MVEQVRQNQSFTHYYKLLGNEKGLSFKQINNNIKVQKLSSDTPGKPEIEVIIQGVEITGRVTSTDDLGGLPGVNVILKGTSQGTVTDVEGNYLIDVPDENSILVFSSVGFVTQEIAVGNQTILDLVMTADITALEEIVVVGYGTQKKANLTGAVDQPLLQS